MRQQRLQRPLGQRAVPDFAAAGAADHLHFAGREGREVVVQHERLRRLAGRRRCCRCAARRPAVPRVDRPRAPASRRAVKSAEPWVRGRTPVSIADRADRVEVAAVDPLALVQHLVAHDAVLDVLELGGDVLGPAPGTRSSSCSATSAAQLLRPRPTRPALSFALIALRHRGLGQRRAPSRRSAASGSALVHSIFGLADLVDQLLLQRDEVPDALLGHLERLEHLRFGDLQRAALDHDDRVAPSR